MCILKIWKEIREVHRLALEEFEADAEALYQSAVRARDEKKEEK